MIKKLLAAALGLAFAAPVFADASNVTLYGRMHQSVVSQNNDAVNGGASRFDMEGVSSRFGIRGVEDLGGGLKAIFGYEQGIAAEDGAGGAGGQARNVYVGLDSDAFGKFSFGRLDGAINAPLYNQIFKGISAINHDGGTAQFSSTRSDSLRANQRVSNAIGHSIKVGSVQIDSRLALNPGLANPLGNTGGSNSTAVSTLTGVAATAVAPAGNLNGDQGSRNFSIAATTKIGNLDIGGGYERDDYTVQTAANSGLFDDRMQLVVGYQFGDLRVGGVLARNTFEQTSFDNETELGLSAKYKLTANSNIIGNYFTRDDARLSAAANREVNRDQFQVGYTYDFSKRTMSYVMFDRLEASDRTALDITRDAFIAGIRHNF